MQLNKAWWGDWEKRQRGEGMKERWGDKVLLRSKMRATEGREEIDEGMGRGMGSSGRRRGSGRTGENMRDEGYQLGLDRKCVSINILYLGLADHTLALGDHETQYRSQVPWWMRARLWCQPTQRSQPTGTNHSATAPLKAQANTTNGAIYSVRLAWCSLNRLLLLQIYPVGVAVFVNHALDIIK